jgi:hypothetical protein
MRLMTPGRALDKGLSGGVPAAILGRDRIGSRPAARVSTALATINI